VSESKKANEAPEQQPKPDEKERTESPEDVLSDDELDDAAGGFSEMQ
jgi:hypothetical protein